MEIRRVNISVVVLARDHNPTILHPSFLSSQGIVPTDWELAEPPLCTLPMSVVKYKNGIEFTVQSNRLQVLQSPPPLQLHDSVVPQLVEKYIEKLPHVRYTAVGINMAIVLVHPEPEKFLIERFLAFEHCNFDDLRLKAVGLRFTYPVDKAILNLSCDPGKVELRKSADQILGVIVNANYHHELVGHNVVEEVKEAISTFRDRCAHFEDIVITKVFGIEGKNEHHLS